MSGIRVGILTLQGDYARHEAACRDLGVAPVRVRTAEALESIDGLIIPGGESTTIGRLMSLYGLLDPLIKHIRNGMPVFGTCAGMVLLAQHIEDSDQTRLGVLDITVQRNAYGRQLESFEAELDLHLGKPVTVPAIFIRAPQVLRYGSDVTVLGSFEDAPVLLRSGNILTASFHPELTDDRHVHDYFFGMICSVGSCCSSSCSRA